MKYKASVLAGVAVTLVFLSACRKAGFVEGGQFLGQRRGQVFSILIYTDKNNSTKCDVNNKVVTLWASQGQIARWISDDKKAYTVDFTAGTNNPPPGNPFQDQGHPKPPFPVPAGGHVDSGPPTGSGYYQYAVRDSSGNICDPASDPGIYIK